MDRLSAQDLSMVWPDDLGWPQDIGALALIDGGALLDADGRLSLGTLREHIAGRLHLVPRFRQLLHSPRRGLGWPLWVDAHDFDIAQHVQALEVPAPGGEEELLRTCEELQHRRLDRSRPLWEMWFLSGLQDGRIGLVMKVHHAIADGISGISLLAAFVDLEPDPPRTEPDPWTPAAMPTPRELFGDNVRRRADGIRRTLVGLRHPGDRLGEGRQVWPAVAEMFAEGKAPPTSFNRRIGSRRRFAIVRSELGLAKDVAHAHGAKANDVVLTATAGGLRSLLAGRGERVDDLVLRAFVPVSLHPDGDTAAGNLNGGMFVPLPIGEADDVRRLQRVAVESAERKRRARPPAGTLFRFVVLQKTFLRLLARQRMTNVYVANVPGPPVPVYLAGARVHEVFPIVPITGNMALGAGALSYAGQLNLTAVADHDIVPDLGAFEDGVRASLHALARSAPLERSA